MIYSFDIFDTLITRITGTPEGVFAIMQHHLLSEPEYQSYPMPLREDFYHARIHLEQEKRNHTDAEDITISDIYDFISDSFKLSAKQKNQLLELEIETEISVMVGVEEMISKVKQLVGQGEKVILVSDMYLRKIDVIRILDSVDPFISRHCDLFLSSELNKTKLRGTLFAHIIDHYDRKPSEILHTGDNELSDILRPRQKKIGTLHYSGAKNNYYENFAVTQKSNNIGLQIMVGISKLARMELQTELEKSACSLAGPWICTFVKWVLDQAKQDGRKRLYFLARDGELLTQVVERLKRSRPAYWDLECRYLRISRQSAVYPSLEKMDRRAVDHILQKHPYLNVDMIAERTYTPREELIGFFKNKYGIRLEGTHIGEKTCKRIEKILRTDPELQNIVLFHRDAKRELILKYFEQEGLFSEDTIGLVDVGWQCTIQDAIYHIVQKSPYRDKKIIGYYYGVTKYSEDTTPGNQKIPFAFYPFSPAHVFNKPYYVIWMELFCSSNLDVTIDYAADADRISAHQRPSKTNKDEWIDQIRRGIFAYTDTFARFQAYSQLDFSRDQNYYMAVFLHPDRNLAECIGKLYYSSDPLDSNIGEFAPKLKLSNLRDISKPGFIKWWEGSLRRSPIAVRLMMIGAVYGKRKIKELQIYSKTQVKRLLWKFMPLL